MARYLARHSNVQLQTRGVLLIMAVYSCKEAVLCSVVTCVAHKVHSAESLEEAGSHLCQLRAVICLDWLRA